VQSAPCGELRDFRALCRRCYPFGCVRRAGMTSCATCTSGKTRSSACPSTSTVCAVHPAFLTCSRPLNISQLSAWGVSVHLCTRYGAHPIHPIQSRTCLKLKGKGDTAVVLDAILLSWIYRILGDSHRDWLTCDRFCLKPWTTPQSLSSFWASDAIQDSLSFNRTAWARAQSTSAAFKVAPWVCLAVPVCCLNSPDDSAYGPKSAPDAGLLRQVEQFHLFDCRDVACVRHRVRNVMQDA
jgi:hypothetical protein